MREKAIEAQLVQATKHRSGLALKFTSPGMAGVPDRILLMPGGRAAFAELKAPRQAPASAAEKAETTAGGIGLSRIRNRPS